MNLSSREWKEFFIGKLFIIKKVNGLPIENYEKGTLPYISTSTVNNGLIDCIEADLKAISDEKSISIDPIKGKPFYHPYKFVGRGFSGASINILYSNKINKEVALFLCSVIEHTAKYKASYGYLFNSNRLKRGKILLPIGKTGEPDYEFMEQYIKELNKKKTNEYIEYAQTKLKDIKYKKIESLDSKEWKGFCLDNICYIKSGRDIYDAEREIGNIPYITSTSYNNGIKYCVSNTNDTIESNAISVNRNGSVGYAFYHKYKALYSNDCRKLKLKDNNNEYISLFLTNQIVKQKEKYNYGYKMGTGRLKKQIIMLPINKAGKPDYEYMEQYIKNLMYEKYDNYLEYIIKKAL